MIRSGTTLIEVLVAIFVTALGLLGILALFPLGAVSMAQAIKDSRCTQASANAFALAEALNIRNDPSVIGNPDVFVNQGSIPPANLDGPSYPVFVDPIGLLVGKTFLPDYSSIGLSLSVKAVIHGPICCGGRALLITPLLI